MDQVAFHVQPGGKPTGDWWINVSFHRDVRRFLGFYLLFLLYVDVELNRKLRIVDVGTGIILVHYDSE